MIYMLGSIQIFRRWLTIRENLVAITILPALAILNFLRFFGVNPVILGDEYIYATNARLVAPWGVPVEGDYSNYLFNIVYAPTNLCGAAFYECAKGLNGVFFLGFVLIIYVVATSILPRWWSVAFAAAISLSPLSVYTSMFLPETLFFFFVSLILVAVLRAMLNPHFKAWAIVGVLTGLASLVKPHAWLTAVAIGILLVISAIGLEKKRVVNLARNSLGFSVAAVATRLIVGLAIAGPKATGFFGVYFSVDVLNSAGQVDLGGRESIGAGPLNGALALFPEQFSYHLFTTTALIGVALVGLLIGVISVFKRRNLDRQSALALVAFVWLATLLIEIVLFTGWVTGGGDDHTTRILLRYYEFLIPIAMLGGLGILSAYTNFRVSALTRWVSALIFVAVLSQAFSGIFGSLTLQIADAPWLAGLVVNFDVYSAVAIGAMVTLIVFATFPRLSGYTVMLFIVASSVSIGGQISNQYQEKRGVASAADLGGKLYGQYISASPDLKRHLVVANTRFDATLAALWASSVAVEYGIYPAGTTLDYTLGEDTYDSLLVLGDIEVIGAPGVVEEGEGFRFFKLRG